MNLPLTLALLCAVIGYSAYVLHVMRRNRSRGCGSCSGCPYAGRCGEQKKRS